MQGSPGVGASQPPVLLEGPDIRGQKGLGLRVEELGFRVSGFAFKV